MKKLVALFLATMMSFASVATEGSDAPPQEETNPMLLLLIC